MDLESEVVTCKADLPTVCPLREWEVVGSIPSRDRLKSLKPVVVAPPPPPFGVQEYRNSTTTGPPVSG